MILKEIYDAVCDLICEATWDWRGLPYSYEHYKLMSHEGDRKLYLDACHKLWCGSERETFVTHDGETFIITQVAGVNIL